MTADRAVVGMLEGGLRFGEPQRSGPLTLVPVFHDGEQARYLLFAAAAGEGLAQVEEVGSGAVPELRVVNRADCGILLLEGEVLGGLRQTRTLNTTVLVPAHATVVIPVSCVEAGRWGAARPMARETLHASPRIRSPKNLSVQKWAREGAGYRSHQGEVWGAVEQHLSLHKVGSATFSYADVHRRRGDTIAKVAEPLRPVDGQRGVLALAGGRPLALDVFDRPETLSFLWSGLVGSYAADALVARDGGRESQAAPAGARVAALARGEASAHAAVGEGTAVFVTTEDAVVSALVVGTVLVHLAALWSPEGPDAAPEVGRPPAAGRASWFGEAP